MLSLRWEEMPCCVVVRPLTPNPSVANHLAVASLSQVAREYEFVVTHGNGSQVEYWLSNLRPTPRCARTPVTCSALSPRGRSGICLINSWQCAPGPAGRDTAYPSCCRARGSRIRFLLRNASASTHTAHAPGLRDEEPSSRSPGDSRPLGVASVLAWAGRFKRPLAPAWDASTVAPRSSVCREAGERHSVLELPAQIWRPVP